MADEFSTETEPISPDLPAFRVLAQYFGIAPLRLAVAVNDPEHLAERELLTMDEIDRWHEGLTQLDAVIVRITAAAAVARDAALALLAQTKEPS